MPFRRDDDREPRQLRCGDRVAWLGGVDFGRSNVEWHGVVISTMGQAQRVEKVRVRAKIPQHGIDDRAYLPDHTLDVVDVRLVAPRETGDEGIDMETM